MSAHQRKGPCFGQRHVLILLLHLGNLMDYSMRVNLSVGLVAMVNNTDNSDKNVSNECPSTSFNVTQSATAPGEKFDWSKQLQGLVLSAFFWGYFILQAPAGTLAQRFGAKWIFGVSILITGVLTILTPFMARISVYLLIAVRALEGFIRGVSYPTMMAMLGRWVPPQEATLLLNIADFGSIVGTVIGQLTAGPLSASTFFGGWPSVFYTGGAAAVLWFLPWSLFVFDTPDSHPRISEEEKAYIHASIGADQSEANAHGLPWRRIFGSPAMWAYIINMVISSWIFFTLLTCLPQFLSEVLHFDIAENGMIASLPYIAYAGSSLFYCALADRIIASGRFSKSVVRKTFNSIAFFGVGGCVLGVTFVSCDAMWVIVLLVIGYALYGANYAGFYSNALDLSPEYSGTVFGIGNTFATLTGIVTPIITDYITKHHTIREWNLVFYIASGLVGFVAVLYLCIGSGERQKWRVEEEEDDEAPILAVNAEEEEPSTLPVA